MRIFIFIALFVFSYQRFIIQNLHAGKTCDSSVQQGVVLVPDRCSLVDPNQQIYAVARHKGDSYVQSFNCNENCSTCRMNQEVKYVCVETGPNAFKSYYGVPSPVTSTGFFFDVFPSSDLCNANAPVFQTSYIIETRCFSQQQDLFHVKMNKEQPKSQRIGFNQERNGVILQEFSEADCKGDVTATHFFPSGKCSDIPNAPAGYQIKVRKSL